MNVEQRAEHEINKMFVNKKFKNVAELTATYNQKEIKKLIEVSLNFIALINEGARHGILEKHFGSVTKALFFKAFVESQTIFLKRALLYNEGALVFGFKSIENNICEGILYQN